METPVLVTGGAGFIGSHIVDRLVLEGCNVRVLDNFSSGRLENIRHHGWNVEVLDVDLKDPQAAVKAAAGVEAVFHFSANPEVRVSTTNPDIHFSENVVATFNLLEAMRKADVKQLVFASSSSVYGEPEAIPVDESAPIRPVSVYGASKAACESLIHAYSRLYGIGAVALRYANVVGPRLRHGVVYDFIVKLTEQPDVLEILGDGTQTRSYIYISDAVDATMAAWESLGDGFEAYNVGSEDWVDVNEIASIVASVMGLRGVRYKYKPVLHGVGWPGDVKKIALTIDRLKGLGWKPKMDSRRALREAARSILEELKGKL
ncbi:MAG: NAD-dependent epimerase/dehydratase family protein [Candidatus Bathyarchaeota archaeon]|nr:NAD-dependent epimerase/dehydratase family protein [Candidatus Bathyarchaeota archaeon]